MKKYLLLVAAICSILILPACSKGVVSTPPADAQAPFSLTVKSAQITINQPAPGQELQNGEQSSANWLSILVSIENTTQQDYKDVRYTLALNEEVKPYIATQVIRFETPEPVLVSTPEKVEAAPAPKAGQAPLVTGFSHDWGMRLTTAEDLAAYEQLTPEKIADALKNITITVTWDGGSQSATIPLSVQYPN